jgi:hypothetical protein
MATLKGAIIDAKAVQTALRLKWRVSVGISLQGFANRSRSAPIARSSKGIVAASRTTNDRRCGFGLRLPFRRQRIRGQRHAARSTFAGEPLTAMV